MAYFNHAFQKTLLGESAAANSQGFVTAGSIVDFAPNGTNGVGSYAFIDQDATNVATPWPVIAAPSAGQPLTLVATALYQNDKVGPFHGGYQETTKSKKINPKYVSKFYKVNSEAALSHIIGVSATPNLDLAGADADCCATFLCSETYEIRFDLKGEAALRALNHNAYEVAAAYTGCCPVDPADPLEVDPALVMEGWMDYIVNDPILSGVYGQTDQRLVNVGMTVTCDVGATWDLYLPNNLAAGIAGVYFEADGTTLTTAGTAFVASVEAGIGGGAAATLGAIVAGTLYVDATGVPVTGGTGVGMTVDITTVAGGITVVAINDPGLGYTATDVVTIAQVGSGLDGTVVISTIAGFAFTSVTPISTYVSAFTPATPNCCAGLVLESAFVETTFGDCTFMPTDHFAIEPLLIQASMLDETGDPCVFEQLCISDGITPSGASSQTIMPAIQFGRQAMGTGEQVLRELILSESYDQNFFNTSNDLRIREITQGYDVSNAIDRTALYTCYYILHTVPRFNNPSGTFDNDQYLLKIPVLAADAAFEAYVDAWLTAANNPVQMIELDGVFL